MILTLGRRHKVHPQIREAVSMMHRAPYPQAHEISLPRHKISTK